MRKGLGRALRRPVRLSVGDIRVAIGQALGRHVGQALRAARREKALRLAGSGPSGGGEPAGGGASGVVLTTDAPALWIHAIDTGAAGGHEASVGQVQAGTRRQLGVLVDRPEVPVIALHHRQLASRLQQACALASAVAIGGLEVG